MGYKRGHFVLIAKIIISALGYLMLGTFIYVLIVDGSTFNANVLSRYHLKFPFYLIYVKKCNSKCSYIVVNAHRCMIATTTDFYFCIVIVAVSLCLLYTFQLIVKRRFFDFCYNNNV